MKPIILTCSGSGEPVRFLIEIDESTGDAQIVREDRPRVDRDRSTIARIDIDENADGSLVGWVNLAVEVAP